MHPKNGGFMKITNWLRRYFLVAVPLIVAGSLFFWITCGGGRVDEVTAPVEEGEEIQEPLLTIKGTVTLPGSYQPSLAASMGMLKAESADGCTVTVTNQDGVEICTGTVSGGQYECPVLDADLVPSEDDILSVSTDCEVEALCCAHLEECECSCGAIDLSTTLAVWGVELSEINPSTTLSLSLWGKENPTLLNVFNFYLSLVLFWQNEFPDLPGDGDDDPPVAQMAYLVQQYAIDNFGPGFKDYLSAELNMTAFYQFLGMNYGQIMKAEGPASFILSLSTININSFVLNAETLAASLGWIMNLTASISGQAAGLAFAGLNGAADHLRQVGELNETDIDTLIMPFMTNVTNEFMLVGEGTCDTAENAYVCQALAKVYTLTKFVSDQGAFSTQEVGALTNLILEIQEYLNDANEDPANWGGMAGFVDHLYNDVPELEQFTSDCIAEFGGAYEACSIALEWMMYEFFGQPWVAFDFTDFVVEGVIWMAPADLSKPADCLFRWDSCTYPDGEVVSCPESPSALVLGQEGMMGMAPSISITKVDSAVKMLNLETPVFEEDGAADADIEIPILYYWSEPLYEKTYHIHGWADAEFPGSGIEFRFIPLAQGLMKLRFIADTGECICRKDFIRVSGGPVMM